MIKAIIFDFDGVIIESFDMKTEAFRESFQIYHNVVDDIIQYHLDNYAVSRFVKFKYIYENFLKLEYNDAEYREISERFSTIMFKKAVNCPFVNGAEEFLEQFSMLVPLYLVSGTPHEELEQIVEKRDLRKYFKHIWGTPPGTKKQFITGIRQRENCEPNEAIYIGDMLGDLELAKTTGTLFVGRELKQSFEEFNVPSFPNLVGIREWIEDCMST